MCSTIVRAFIAYAAGLLLLITGMIQNGISGKERWVDFSKLSQELSVCQPFFQRMAGNECGGIICQYIYFL